MFLSYITWLPFYVVCLPLCLSHSHKKENMQLYGLLTSKPLILLMVGFMLLFSLFHKLINFSKGPLKIVWLNGHSKLRHSELVIYPVFAQASVTTNCLCYKNYHPKRSALKLGWLLPALQNLALMANNCKGFFICVLVTVQCASSSFAVWEGQLFCL